MLIDCTINLRAIWTWFIVIGVAATCSCNRDQPADSSTIVPEAMSASWAVDYNSGLADARAKHRPMLIAFSGPSWSDPCRTLMESVFSDSRFDNWARSRVVLVQVDVPRPESPRSAELEQLLLKFQVNTFPMVMIVDADEMVLGTIPGSSDQVDIEDWLDEADRILADRAAPESAPLDEPDLTSSTEKDASI